MKKLILALILCGAALSCSHEDQFLEEDTELDTPIATRSGVITAETENAIAQIVEDKFAEYKDHKIYWGTVVIMDVESGYTRTINCSAFDDKIGQADTNYAEEPIYQGGAFLPIPFMSLLDEGGVKPTDMVDLEAPRQLIGGIRVSDPFQIGSTTFSDAFTKGSNIAIVKGCYDKLNLKKADDLHRAMGYGEPLSPVKMLRAYNVIPNKGRYIDNKYDIDEPTKVLEEAMFSEWATEECMKCMIQHAIDRKIDGLATYSGVAQVPDELGRWNTSLYTMTNVGFYPIDNPKYSILVSFRTKYTMYFLGNPVLSAIIEELNKE